MRCSPTTAFFCLRVAQAPLPRRGRMRRRRHSWSRSSAGTALAAITLVPFAESVAHSDLVARRATFAPYMAAHQPVRDLLTLFFPDFWGRPTQTPAQYVFLQEIAYYAGALTLMLGLSALVLRRALERIAVAVFAVFAIAIAVGIPPIFGVVTSLPGFHTARNDRIAVLFLFCLALLAGWGLDELTERVPPPRPPPAGARRLRCAAVRTAARGAGQRPVARASTERARGGRWTAESRRRVVGIRVSAPGHRTLGGARMGDARRRGLWARGPAAAVSTQSERVRGAGHRADRRRPVQGRGGLQPGDSPVPCRPAADRRDPVSPVSGSESVRRGGIKRVRARSAATERRDAVRAV